jgi:putative PIN family toxin of toxin-antitoxin system
MAINRKRIVLDTNLWISFLITKDLSKLDNRIFTGETILIFSQELLHEFITVVSRLKFKKYFSQEEIIEILDIIDQQAIFVEVTSEIKKCRDEKDNFLLSLAVDGNADFLITGDQDLLELKAIEKTQIVTINQYLEVK